MARYGTGIDWNEFHTNTPWNNTDQPDTHFGL